MALMVTVKCWLRGLAGILPGRPSGNPLWRFQVLPEIAGWPGPLRERRV